MAGEVTAPIVGPTTTPVAPDEGRFVTPRLTRHLLTLDDGHQVGVAVCGRGVPLVVVHGFSAEGILYAQTLVAPRRPWVQDRRHRRRRPRRHARTAHRRRNVHRATPQLLGRVLDHLGIEKAVLAGHSMGGRLVTELAASEPDRAIAVILLDAIVGDTWDHMVNVFRLCPPLLAGVGVTLGVDTLTTIPLFRDPAQARKLGRLVTPTLLGHVRRPWRMLGPGVSILRSRGSRWMLERIAEQRIPLFAIHGDRDLAVPMATSRSAARRARGELVVVHGASHAWMLKDPESLPAIMHRLMQGRLGTAVLKAILDAGIDPNDATDDEIETAFYRPDAMVLELTPLGSVRDGEQVHRRPRYRFTITMD